MEKFRKRFITENLSREINHFNLSTEKSSSSRLRLLHFAEVECFPGKQCFAIRLSECWIFHLAEKGKRKIMRPGRMSCTLAPDDVYVENPFLHKGITGKEYMENDTSAPVRRYYFAMERNFYAEQMFHLDRMEKIHMSDPDAVFDCLGRIRDLIDREEGCSEHEISMLLFRFLTLITCESQENSSCASSHQQLIDEVAHFPQNYPTRRSLENAFKVSPVTLRRIFHRFTGKSPMDFVIHSRLFNSCWMLTNTELPIREIAALNGYSNPVFYCKSFKKVYGLSPNQYRKKNRKQEIAISKT